VGDPTPAFCGVGNTIGPVDRGADTRALIEVIQCGQTGPQRICAGTFATLAFTTPVQESALKLHVVDGTFELYRAHFSKRPGQTSPSGQDVKATVGVIASVLGLLDDPSESCTHIGVAFDNPIESFRNDMFAGYKTGDGMDPILVDQMDLVERAIAACGIVVWRMDQWEADDALGTAAVRWRNDVEQVRIMTPDKDLGQCVTGDRVVLVDQIRKRVINEDGVRERNGVDPESIPDWLGLVGDTADGIPGLPGFGAKTAAILLNRYRAMDNIPDDENTWDVKVRGAPRLGKTLRDNRESARLFRDLARLALDVPLAESLDDLEWHGARRDDFESLEEDLGRIRYQPSRWVC
jgi:5'-3' exonuclease